MLGPLNLDRATLNLRDLPCVASEFRTTPFMRFRLTGVMFGLESLVVELFQGPAFLSLGVSLPMLFFWCGRHETNSWWPRPKLKDKEAGINPSKPLYARLKWFRHGIFQNQTQSFDSVTTWRLGHTAGNASSGGAVYAALNRRGWLGYHVPSDEPGLRVFCPPCWRLEDELHYRIDPDGDGPLNQGDGCFSDGAEYQIDTYNNGQVGQPVCAHHL